MTWMRVLVLLGGVAFFGMAQAEETKAPVQKAPAGMVLIPAGEFWMGCNPERVKGCEANEKPGHPVDVPAFFMDVKEVSVADYGRCVKDGACKRPISGRLCNRLRKDRQDHPVNCVSWHQAKAYCRFVDKRLPSEAEWEKAARGPERRLYPWGDEKPDCDKAIFDNGKAACGRKMTWPVGSKPAGASSYGVLNTAGNVSEWVADRYHRNYRKAPTDGSPWLKPRRVNRIARGGSLGHPGIRMRIARRHAVHPSIQVGYIGFRCAKDGPARKD